MRANAKRKRKPTYYADIRPVEDGIILFKRGGTLGHVWWFRVRTGVRRPAYVRRTTNQTDEGKARSVARRAGYKIQALAKETEGRGLVQRTFAQVVAAYLDEVEQQTEAGLIGPSRLTRDSANATKWMDYLSRQALVGNLSQEKVDGYPLYRRKMTPSIQEATIGQEVGTYNRIIKWALYKGWLKSNEVVYPRYHLTKKSKRRRDTFTPEELQRILTFMRDDYTHVAPPADPSKPETREERRARHNGAVSASAMIRRKQLFNLIRFLAGSGMRVDEARSITWACIFKEHGVRFALPLRSKVDRYGEDLVPAMLEPLAVEGLADQRKLFPNAKATDLVFRGRGNEKPIGDPNETFRKEILEPLGLQTEEGKVNRTLTSFRHFYATELLGEGMSDVHLAEIMRTSAQQIRDHYGHVKHKRVAAEHQKKREAAKPKGPTKLPSEFHEKLERLRERQLERDIENPDRVVARKKRELSARRMARTIAEARKLIAEH